MRPLQSVAMGLVIVLLAPRFAGYDALPDPLGWVLVLLGTAGLPADLERRRELLALAGLALAVAVPLWWPGVADATYDVHPSLGWALNLPQLGFAALLSLVLGRRAAEAGDRRAGAWGRTAATCFVVAGVLPVLVFGGEVDSLEVPAYLFATVALIVLICCLFSWSGRPWVGTRDREVDQTGS